VFDTELSYEKIIEAIKSGIPQNYAIIIQDFFIQLNFTPKKENIIMMVIDYVI